MKRIYIVFCAMVMFTITGCTSSKELNSKRITITDAKGETNIPEHPKRIVDLSGNSDILAILGYQVIGTANSDAYDYTKLPSYLEDTLQGASIVGYSMQDTMDIEAIMNLEPDLIIISTMQEKMYEQLKEIASVIMVHNEALYWKNDILNLAKVLQKEEEAHAWIQTYEKKAASIGESIKKKYGSDTSYLSFLASGGQFFVFSEAGFGDVLYQDLGLCRPKKMPQQKDISLPVVTYEGLSEIDADYIFLITTKEMQQELETNPVWRNIPAVKKKQIVTLNSSPYFNQGYSPIGRKKLLDEIEGMLDGTD